MEMETEARVAELADRLLDKLSQAVGELDLQTVTHKVKTKDGCSEETREFHVAQPGGTVDRAGLKQLTSVLKELQSITGAVTELELREREARIESLRRGIGVQDVEDDRTGVILIPFRKELEVEN